MISRKQTDCKAIKEVQQAALGEIWKCIPETGPKFKKAMLIKV
jgi:hypothetical protein